MDKKSLEQKDILRKLFRELPQEEPSERFSSAVMARVMEVEHQKRRRARWINVLLPLAGAVALILLSGLALYLSGWKADFQVIEREIFLQSIARFWEKSGYLFGVGLIALLLLIFDSLLRRHRDRDRTVC